jgi:hypothetical protein
LTGNPAAMCSFRAFRPVALRGHLSVALPLGIIEHLCEIEVNRPNGYFSIFCIFLIALKHLLRIVAGALQKCAA